MLPAPPTFSMMTVAPIFFCRCSDTMRAKISAVPPAANGTMLVIGRLG
jgi:hypothetical protein